MYFLVHTWRNDFKKNCKSYKGQGNVFFSIDLGGMTLKKSQVLQGSAKTYFWQLLCKINLVFSDTCVFDFFNSFIKASPS